MIDGLWIVHAQGPQGSAGGVAVFANGKIFGGDSGFFYVGNYQGEEVIKARVAVHNFDQSIVNIMNVATDYELEITATLSGETMTGTAVIPGMGAQSMSLRLEKKANF